MKTSLFGKLVSAVKTHTAETKQAAPFRKLKGDIRLYTNQRLDYADLYLFRKTMIEIAENPNSPWDGSVTPDAECVAILADRWDWSKRAPGHYDVQKVMEAAGLELKRPSKNETSCIYNLTAGDYKRSEAMLAHQKIQSLQTELRDALEK